MGAVKVHIFSEKAAKFCEIFPLLLSTVHTDKSKGKITQNFVVISEYMNFMHGQLVNWKTLRSPSMKAIVTKANTQCNKSIPDV